MSLSLLFIRHCIGDHFVVVVDDEEEEDDYYE